LVASPQKLENTVFWTVSINKNKKKTRDGNVSETRSVSIRRLSGGGEGAPTRSVPLVRAESGYKPETENIHSGKSIQPQNVLKLISRTVLISNRLCGLVVTVLGYRSGGPGSIPGTTKKKKKRIWNGVNSASRVQLRSYLIEK
jgi:hypothetical protein